MLLAYIWIGFFTITYLWGRIRTFVLPETNVLYKFNAIPEMIITLFNFSKNAFERIRCTTINSTRWLRRLKSPDFASIFAAVVVPIVFLA